VYGKLDFILLESRPWWREWKPMIEKLTKQEQKPIYADPMTGNVLNSIFNQPILKKYQWHFRGSSLNINFMDRSNSGNGYRCIVNLHGFTPSWVPEETRHWKSRWADTSLYYHYKGIRGDALKEYLKENPLKYCDVFF
jgi:hypothetical protein